MPTDVTPSFYTNTPFHQFQVLNGGSSALYPLSVLIDSQPIHTYSDFSHVCAEQGFAPEHWPALWAAFDASDGVRDNVFSAQDDDDARSGQIKQINQAINSVLDPDNTGFIDAAEYRAASGRERPQMRVLPADAQDSAYRLTDLNGDGAINGVDEVAWDDHWAETHGGSFYADPQNGARRAAAIAGHLVALNKTFNLFGESHELHPWQDIGAAIRAFKAAGAPVIYAVEADAGIVTLIDGAPSALSWLGGVHGHKVRALGIEVFGQSGDQIDLYTKYRLDVEAVLDAAADVVI